jgi:hypothetical protein
MAFTGSNKHVSVSKSNKISLSAKQAARGILVLAVTAKLSPEAREKILTLAKGDIDWQYLLELAEYHGVGPLLAYNLLHCDLNGVIPGPYAEKLNKIYHSSLYQNIILADELKKVLAVFEKSNIPVIVLKGVTLAELLYDNPGLRVMTDIDVVVPPDIVSKAKSSITELGYQPQKSLKKWEHTFHEVPYFKQAQLPVFIEIHRNLEDPALVNIPLSDIWDRAKSFQMQGLTSLLLSPEDTLLYLSNCFVKPSNFNLKTLADITELLKKYKGALDWNYILKSAQSWQVNIPLRYTLEKAQLLLEAPVPESGTKIMKPGFFRNLLLCLLINNKTFISPIKWQKLRTETLTLHCSLMIDRPRGMRAVLLKFRGPHTRVPWLRTSMWIFFVVFVAVWRNILSLCGQKSGIV